MVRSRDDDEGQKKTTTKVREEDEDKGQELRKGRKRLRKSSKLFLTLQNLKKHTKIVCKQFILNLTSLGL
jgi:hypothetical protein